MGLVYSGYTSIPTCILAKLWVSWKDKARTFHSTPLPPQHPVVTKSQLLFYSMPFLWSLFPLPSANVLPWVPAQWHLSLCNPLDINQPGSSVHRDFPGKNTGIGCRFLLQRIFASQGSNPHLLNFLYWQGDLLQLSHLGSLTSYPKESLSHNWNIH